MAHKKALFSFLFVALLLVAGGLYFFLYAGAPKDPILRTAFQNAAKARSYEQYVDTSANVDNKSLRIIGFYLIDQPRNAYAFYSTTTVEIPGSKKPVIFTLDNISIEKDVYTKVTTKGDNVPLSVPSSPFWLHFKANDIPKDYANIALSGPLLDYLKLFSGRGRFLSLIAKVGAERIDGATLLHYTFALSNSSVGASGTLLSLIKRIGPTGTIDVWIDEKTKVITVLRFRNENYVATTTISHINENFGIRAPAISEQAILSP
jgi:hypothetical protein